MSTALAPANDPERISLPVGPVFKDDIHTAMARVYEKVSYVQKETKGGLGYSFASERAIIETLRPAMVENGIIVHVVEIRDVEREAFQTRNGGTSNRTTMLAVVRFAHAPSGTHIDVQALGEGVDVGDKSSNKAMTIALKYALRQTFMLETGDDPDQTPSHEYERTPRRPVNVDEHGEIHDRTPQRDWNNAELLALLKEHALGMGDLAGELGTAVTKANYQQLIDLYFIDNPDRTLANLVESAARRIQTVAGDPSVSPATPAPAAVPEWHDQFQALMKAHGLELKDLMAVLPVNRVDEQNYVNVINDYLLVQGHSVAHLVAEAAKAKETVKKEDDLPFE